jgi:hypothetical protein
MREFPVKEIPFPESLHPKVHEKVDQLLAESIAIMHDELSRNLITCVESRNGDGIPSRQEIRDQLAYVSREYGAIIRSLIAWSLHATQVKAMTGKFPSDVLGKG